MMEPHDQNDIASPYQSPIISLHVGLQTGNPAKFFVHKDKVINIPFFAAALRENAFLEGQQRAVTFEEEDPIYFGRVVEFIYEGDCFPHWKSPAVYSLRLGNLPAVQKTIADSVPEKYNPSLSFGVSSGTYISTKETSELFSNILELLCVADRYGIEALVDNCLQKLKIFPVGTREVALLSQHVLGSIPESRKDVYSFFAEHVNIQLPWLMDCPDFRMLLESEFSMVPQGIAKLLIKTAIPFHISRVCNALKKGGKIALCITNVTVEECIEKYGADGKEHGYPVKFGTAKAGEIFETDGSMSERGIYCVRRGSNEPQFAVPGSHLKILAEVGRK